MNDPDREVIGLDFETYGATSLPDHGLVRYMKCQTFRPLIAATYDERGNTQEWDFVLNPGCTEEFLEYVSGKVIVAHNALFEWWVLQMMGLDKPVEDFIDSAVIARAMGAASHLEAAAPQLLDVDKMEMGKALIKIFSIPGVYQVESGSPFFDEQVIKDRPSSWNDFMVYCRLDAKLSFRIWDEWCGLMPKIEWQNQAITLNMNIRGWPIDVALVEEMHRRYLENLASIEADFRATCDAMNPIVAAKIAAGEDLKPEPLNLNSLPQLKQWCADRGIRATSFDEAHVASLHARLTKRMATMADDDPKFANFWEVRELLTVKQELGGSSLKKLKVMLDTEYEDRLYDQYAHIGAGQSYRTSGRGVQMQNLKRLGAEADEVDELLLLDSWYDWNNDKLAKNIRQVFRSSDEFGELIVGDFSSVESRGLAWLAGEQWKLNAYRQGQDLYKVLAARIKKINIEYVDKDGRQFGKVGELSCGYQAGGGAVQAFAAKMGTELSEGEAASLVYDWRDANPSIVQLWADLQELLEQVIGHGASFASFVTWCGYTIKLRQLMTPKSLVKINSRAQSIALELVHPNGYLLLTRVFHGVQQRGKDFVYYKPSELKGGALWKDGYIDPKTKQFRNHTIYGGKLAGILTQSTCREIFFQSLRRVEEWASRLDNVQLIGQFHDEIVLDWQPPQRVSDTTLTEAKYQLSQMMSEEGRYRMFPLAADIKHAHRYTK